MQIRGDFGIFMKSSISPRGEAYEMEIPRSPEVVKLKEP
jgi:hypothetical protein